MKRSVRRGSAALLWVVLVLAACEESEGPPVDVSDLPDGFYRMQGRTREDSDEVLQVRHDGETIHIGIEYHHLFYGVSDIEGQVDAGRFSGLAFLDSQRTYFEGTYDGVRVLGTARDVVEGGELGTRSFSIEPADVPWMLGEGTYRLYGSESVDLAGAGYTPVAFGSPWTYRPRAFGAILEEDWTLLGEATESASFELDHPYPVLMITWAPDTSFAFDSLVDEVADVYLPERMRDDSNRSPSTYVNFVAYASVDPFHLVGPPDGRAFQPDPGLAGFLAITFPDNETTPAIDPETGRGQVRVVLRP